MGPGRCRSRLTIDWGLHQDRSRGRRCLPPSRFPQESRKSSCTAEAVDEPRPSVSLASLPKAKLLDRPTRGGAMDFLGTKARLLTAGLAALTVDCASRPAVVRTVPTPTREFRIQQVNLPSGMQLLVEDSA